MKKVCFVGLLGIVWITWSCESRQAQGEKEVPTTLEQHDSNVQSSSSWASGTNSTVTSASISTREDSVRAPVSFTFSGSGAPGDSSALVHVREISRNKELREFLQVEMIRLMLKDGLIDSEGDKINLVITNEWVMVNKRLIDDSMAKRYVDVLASRMKLSPVFNYSFNQY